MHIFIPDMLGTVSMTRLRSKPSYFVGNTARRRLSSLSLLSLWSFPSNTNRGKHKQTKRWISIPNTEVRGVFVLENTLLVQHIQRFFDAGDGCSWFVGAS